MKNIAVQLKDVQLDLENPRHRSVEEESEAIELLYANEKILELAQDIVKVGLSPAEKIILIKNNNKYVVVEGNRRVAALKLLANQNLCRDDKIRKKFQKIITDSQYKAIRTLDAVLASSRDQAKIWIKRKHFGGNKGTGVKPWNSIQKAREDPDSQDRFSLLILDCLSSKGFISEQDVNNCPITTMSRIVNSVFFKKKTGVYYDHNGDEIKFLSEDSGIFIFLADLIRELVDKKIDSRTLNSMTRIEDYLNTLFDKFGLDDDFDIPENERKKEEKTKENGEASDVSGRDDNSGSGGSESDQNTTIPNKGKPLFKRSVYDMAIHKELHDLGYIKLCNIYGSIKKLNTDKDASIVIVAIHCLFESLFALFGKGENCGISNFMQDNRISEIMGRVNYEVFEKGKHIRRVLNEIEQNSNLVKHSVLTAVTNYQTVCNYMEVLNPLLSASIKIALERNCLKNAEQKSGQKQNNEVV